MCPDHDPAPDESAPALPALTEARVVAAYVQAVLAAAAAQGRPAALLESQLGWPAGRLGPAMDDLPVADYLALLGPAAGGDPLFGLRIGEQARLATYPFHGLIVCACPTLRDAVHQTQRYEGLVHDLGRSHLDEADGIATYRWACPWLPGLPAGVAQTLCDSVLSGILQFAGWLVHARLPVLAIGLPYPAPAPALQAAHAAVFGASVHYGQATAWGRIASAELGHAISSADPALAALLRLHADARLAARATARQPGAPAAPPLVRQVRDAIADRLADNAARLDEVAQALACSPRTLQRKLGEAGTSFQAVLEAVRRETADTLLRDPRLQLTDVAYLLGYVEQSSFNRACRDWFGCTPARRRQALMAG